MKKIKGEKKRWGRSIEEERRSSEDVWSSLF